MKLGVLFNLDTTLSLFFHIAKAFLALLLNWLILRYYPINDYVYWAVISSVLMVATASDLGIGQYVVTRLLHSDVNLWEKIVRDAVAGMVPLSLAAGLLVYYGISSENPAFGAGMAGLLALRLLTIPHAAVLNAVNQFKVRKAIDFGVYLLATCVIGFLAAAKYPIHAVLLSINSAFLLGAILTSIVAQRFMPLRQSRYKADWQIWAIYRSATPFMLNNIAGLVSYGGFVWLTSLVLPNDQVAKLAVVHSFVLMNLYQLYDVFLKARQGALVAQENIKHYNLLNVITMISAAGAFAVLGPTMIPLLSDSIRISYLEAALFGLFISLELGNLYFQSVAQVSPRLLNRLRKYSLMRLSMLLVFFIPAIFNSMSIELFLSFLCIFSLVTLLFINRETFFEKTE